MRSGTDCGNNSAIVNAHHGRRQLIQSKATAE